MQPLKGRRVLVTGAARRIGREIALTLARAGARVAFTYLSSEDDARRTMRDLEKLGAEPIALRCDVRREADVRKTVAGVVKKFGGLDLLVNNAGFFETVPFEEITVAQWDRIFEINVRGPYLFAREAAEHLRRSKGRVVNIGSLGGLRPWVTHAHYCASKAALTSLNETMAKALAPEVAVNLVAPGMIDAGGSSDAYYRKLAKKTPMQRAGKPADVAAAVLFFADAPHFIIGQTLVVDGGLELVT